MAEFFGLNDNTIVNAQHIVSITDRRRADGFGGFEVILSTGKSIVVNPDKLDRTLFDYFVEPDSVSN